LWAMLMIWQTMFAKFKMQAFSAASRILLIHYRYSQPQNNARSCLKLHTEAQKPTHSYTQTRSGTVWNTRNEKTGLGNHERDRTEISQRYSKTKYWRNEVVWVSVQKTIPGFECRSTYPKRYVGNAHIGALIRKICGETQKISTTNSDFQSWTSYQENSDLRRFDTAAFPR
jgi:hypothetical protein